MPLGVLEPGQQRLTDQAPRQFSVTQAHEQRETIQVPRVERDECLVHRIGVGWAGTRRLSLGSQLAPRSDAVGCGAVESVSARMDRRQEP